MVAKFDTINLLLPLIMQFFSSDQTLQIGLSCHNICAHEINTKQQFRRNIGNKQVGKINLVKSDQSTLSGMKSDGSHHHDLMQSQTTELEIDGNIKHCCYLRI